MAHIEGGEKKQGVMRKKGEKGREKDERAFPFSSQDIVLHDTSIFDTIFRTMLKEFTLLASF